MASQSQENVFHIDKPKRVSRFSMALTEGLVTLTFNFRDGKTLFEISRTRPVIELQEKSAQFSDYTLIAEGNSGLF